MLEGVAAGGRGREDTTIIWGDGETQSTNKNTITISEQADALHYFNCIELIECCRMMDDHDDTDNKTIESIPYQLSTQLTGHAYTVRDIAVNNNNNTVCILEERGTVHIYSHLPDTTQYIHKSSEQLHNSLVFCIESIDGAVISTEDYKLYPNNTFITGAADKTAGVFDLSNHHYDSLQPHNNSVASITVLNNGLVTTGSWDGQARVWNNGTAIATLTGGEHSVEVCGLKWCDMLVSGSSNKSLILFDSKTYKPIQTIKNAHDHAIKKIVELVDRKQYATASNDGTVKIWSPLSDRPFLVIHAHDDTSASTNTDHPKFIYGLAYNQLAAEIITCGEDGTVKVFDINSGKLVQSIQHPSVVRCVKVLSSGDIISGCADKVARVFTRAHNRVAPKSELNDYTELCNLATQSGMKQLDDSKVLDESALTVPGKKNGEIKIVNVSGKGAMVYQWSEDETTWVEVGEAIGQGGGGVTGQTGKTKLNGKEYDYVTEIYITDTYAVKVGFNRDDDPDDIANAFIATHGISPDNKHDIVAHITPMVDMNAVRMKQQRSQSEALSQQLKHSPSWLLGGGYQMFTDITKLQQMSQRLQQSNTTLHDSDNIAALNDTQLPHLLSMLHKIEKPTAYHTFSITPDELNVLSKLLEWPQSDILPVLDFTRVMMLITKIHERYTTDTSFYNRVICAAENGTDTHITLLHKIVCNYISKRPRSAPERVNPPSIPANVNEFITHVLTLTASKLNNTTKDTMVESYAFLLHNIIIWFGRSRISNDDVFLLVASAAINIVIHPTVKQKPLYYSLMTLASIGLTDQQVQQLIKSTYANELEQCLAIGYKLNNQAVREVTNDVARTYGFR